MREIRDCRGTGARGIIGQDFVSRKHGPGYVALKDQPNVLCLIELDGIAYDLEPCVSPAASDHQAILARMNDLGRFNPYAVVRKAINVEPIFRVDGRIVPENYRPHRSEEHTS